MNGVVQWGMRTGADGDSWRTRAIDRSRHVAWPTSFGPSFCRDLILEAYAEHEAAEAASA